MPDGEGAPPAFFAGAKNRTDKIAVWG